MIPTPRLRFVERLVVVSDAQQIAKTVRTLQQWWAVKINDDILANNNGEWRDVPLEKE